LNFVSDTSSIFFKKIKSTLLKRRVHFSLENGLRIGFSLLNESI